MMKLGPLELQCRYGIPVYRELTLLLNIICTKEVIDITILYQALGAPESNAERHACRLNCKAAVDIRQDKTPMAEHVFNVNGCGYGTNVSAPKINAPN